MRLSSNRLVQGPLACAPNPHVLTPPYKPASKHYACYSSILHLTSQGIKGASCYPCAYDNPSQSSLGLVEVGLGSPFLGGNRVLGDAVPLLLARAQEEDGGGDADNDPARHEQDVVRTIRSEGNLVSTTSWLLYLVAGMPGHHSAERESQAGILPLFHPHISHPPSAHSRDSQSRVAPPVLGVRVEATGRGPDACR